MIQRGSPVVSNEPIRRKLNKSEWGFQQDNEPKHEVHHTNDYFGGKTLTS